MEVVSYTLLNERVRCAQKQHRCIWCGEPILAGSHYVDERSVYDGAVQRGKWHEECLESMRDEAWDEGGFMEYTPYSNERPKL